MKNHYDGDFDHDEWDEWAFIVQPDPIEIKIGRFVGRYVLVPVILSVVGMTAGAIFGLILGEWAFIPLVAFGLEWLKLWQLGALVGFIYGVVR